MELIRNWFSRRFSDPQVLILTVLLVIGFAIVLFLGKILAPLFTAVILAYLLEGIVSRLHRLGVRRLGGVVLVFAGFMALMVVLTFGVVPILSRQITQLVQQFPIYLTETQSLLAQLPERYPNLITQEQMNTFMASMQTEIGALGQKILTTTLSSLTTLVAIVVFLVLVPVLVFFLLKDKDAIIGWIQRFLPRDRHLATRVWHEVDLQIGNYVRGKTLEILIVGAVTYVTFSLLNLQYAILLATLVGFSVLIPYIGAALATIPVALVGFFQFGWSGDFMWVMVAYGIIQLLDGNALVPLLFSEVVDLHPVAIIAAVLLFGGLWGFWGVFFAIPLATLVNAVIRAIPAIHDPVIDPTATDTTGASELKVES